jgi:hypothetical protein
VSRNLRARSWQILLQIVAKVFWGDGQIFPGPLMPFARADMRDHIVSHKTIAELRIGATEYYSGGLG